MDSIEVEGKTYEDAIKKASIELNAEDAADHLKTQRKIQR